MEPVRKDSYRLVITQSRTGVATCAPHRNELPCSLCEAAHDKERKESADLYASKKLANKLAELAKATPLVGSLVKTIRSLDEETSKYIVVSVKEYSSMHPAAIVIGSSVYAFGDPDGWADEVAE